LGFVFGDAGGFFKDFAAVFGFGGEELVDFSLLHDGIGGAADAGVHEEGLDVFEAADFAVEFVFAGAVAEDAAPDGDFGVVDAKLALAVGEGEEDFGHAQGFAGVGAVEDEVGHFASAQGAGGLFAKHPADGVKDVGFAAAIGADNGGDAGVEFQLDAVGKGFESCQLDVFQKHGCLIESESGRWGNEKIPGDFLCC